MHPEGHRALSSDLETTSCIDPLRPTGEQAVAGHEARKLVRVEPDSDLWEAIRELVHRHDREFEPPISDRTTIRDYVEQFRHPPGFMIAALDGDDVVACVGGFVSHPERHVPFLRYAVVDFEYRRGHIATRLLEAAMTLLAERGGASVEAATWSTNAVSRTLLVRLGFELIERHEDDRGSGIDTLLYARALPHTEEDPGATGA